MRIWILVVVGAVLPVVAGVTLGSITSDSGAGTWAHPVEPTAFLLLSLCLAAAHLLVAAGYVAIGRSTAHPVSRWAGLGGVGSVGVGVCEVVSGLLARTDEGAGGVTALTVGYTVTATVVVVATLRAGWLLRDQASPLAAPLLLNGALLAVGTVLRPVAPDAVGIAALSVWSLSYVWLGLRLRSDGRTSVGPAAATA